MMEIILIILAILSIIKTKKWINPASVLLILWSLIIQFSRIGLYELYKTDEKIYYYIFVGLICFFIGFVLPPSKKRIVLRKKNNHYDSQYEKASACLNYEVCYIALIICILITILKLKDVGFDFTNITLFGELDRASYGSKLANMLYEFIAYPLYNTFVCVTVVDFFFGKKDKLLIALSSIMCLGWMLISGGRIAIIRLLISIIICASLKTSTKRNLAKLFSNIKFVILLVAACALFVYFTVLKGFEPFFNIYGDFAIQPKMFEYWAQQIDGQYAYGTASLFGFIYPVLYVIKNGFGLAQIPLVSSVFENIQNTYNSWITLGTFYRCNTYTSCFWYLYYDGRILGIVIGMFLWGTVCKRIFNNTISTLTIKQISIYVLIMIGVVYSFTDMEFWKANYVLAFLFISKLCFYRKKLVFGRKRGV